MQRGKALAGRIRHSDLKALQRRIRESLDTELDMRVHRSISWIRKAGQCEDDPDAGFIFYWELGNYILD